MIVSSEQRQSQHSTYINLVIFNFAHSRLRYQIGVPTQTAANKDPGPPSPEIPKKTGVACKVCVRQIARNRYRAGLIRHPVSENVAINTRIASVLQPKHQPNTIFDKGIESCQMNLLSLGWYYLFAEPV